LEAKAAERAAQVLQDAKRITFKDAAQKYFDQHETKWTNGRHRQQFKSTMEMYVHPIIGKLPVALVDTALSSVLLSQSGMTKTRRRFDCAAELKAYWIGPRCEVTERAKIQRGGRDTLPKCYREKPK
jgi:hypothetical protein